MFKKFVAALMILVLAIGLAGCGSSVRGRGAVISRTIDAAGFTGIVIYGGYDVTFRQADNFSVTLEMHENLFDYLDAGVINRVLVVDFKRNINVGTGNVPKLTIQAPSLESFVVRGAANASLSGSGDSLTIEVEGAANVDALGFAAKYVAVIVTGAGDVDVYASDTLKVTIDGVGSVRYRGNAELTRSVSGVGSITRIE
jgi:hypothetical protein